MNELKTPKEEFEVLPPDELLEGLVVNMRRFDSLKAQQDTMVAAIAESSEMFDELDIEIQAISEQPLELAYKALEYLVSKNRLAAVEKDIESLKSSAIFAEMAMNRGGLYKRKYEITSLDPDKKIGAFYASDTSYRLLNYAGKSYQSRKGRVQRVNLDPATGGFINLLGKTGRIYQAGPLIDRDNNYSPLFEIKDLNP